LNNEVIEERLTLFSDLISRLKEKQSVLDEEKERQESLQKLNELSPRSRRKMFLEKMEARLENQPDEDRDENAKIENSKNTNPFFNITLEESKQIPSENKFAYRIGQHLFLFDARKLLDKGNVKLYDRRRVECITIPVELPMSDEEDPDFETLNYTITDPIVLQIFEDAAGLTGLPSPPKSHKSSESSLTSSIEDIVIEDIDKMSISDDEINNVGIRSRHYCTTI
jgi:hypothetical protein